MTFKKNIIFLIFLSLLSCSTTENLTDKKNTTIVPEVKRTRVSEQISININDKKEFNKQSINGSSNIVDNNLHHSKTYFLYGAEHLKLENYYFDIPVVYNAAVKKWMNYFLNRGRGFFTRYSTRAGQYAPIMGKILEKHGLPRDLIFLAMAESGFQAKAKSWAKAVGPWQFMPFTGKRYGLTIDWYIDERRDPIKSSVAAAKYLTKLNELFGSWELAAAGYNAGEGKIARAIKRYKTENFWRLRKGRYLKSETKNYVPKIMALAIIGKNLHSFGFNDIIFDDVLDFDEVTVGPGIDLVSLSKDLGLDFEEIQALNPEILRWFTPPNIKEYHLKLPVGFASRFEDCCSMTNYAARDFKNYKIKGSRSTLKDVAKKFKIKKSYVLTWLNNKNINRRLKKGTRILLPFRKGQTNKENMYADLYERPRRRVRRRRKYKRRISLALRRGKMLSGRSHYIVKKGDSLWTVSRKNGISLDSLIKSNYTIIRRRQIRAGDRLVVR